MRERLDINLTTLQEETLMYNGGDYAANLQQRHREIALSPAGAEPTGSELTPPDDIDDERM